MSELPTAFRPFARMGWGGRAASHCRGLVQAASRGLRTSGEINRGQVGSAIYRSPGPTNNYAITDVTRDAGGAALGGCAVVLFATGSDQPVMRTVSDASGNFRFDNPGTGPFYVVSYKPGAPDVFGSSVNSLRAA